MKVREPRVLNGEESGLVGAAVVRVTGQLAQGVVRDDDVGAERADLLDQGGDHFVERCVDEPGTAGSRLRVAGIAVSEHARRARAECPQGVGEFRSPGAVGRPRHGDDGGARVRAGVLGEDTAGEEALVVGMGEHAEQGRPGGG